jgi:hypothetical protein
LDNGWLVIIVLDGNELIGVLPLTVSHHRYYIFNLTILKNINNLHSKTGDVIIKRGLEQVVMDQIINQLKLCYKTFIVNVKYITLESPMLNIKYDKHVLYNTYKSRDSYYIDLKNGFNDVKENNCLIIRYLEVNKNQWI